MAERKSVDWEVVEREFRAGQLSIREIARQHGATDTAIRKRAKAKGWARDLAERVAAKVRSDLVRGEVCTPEERELSDREAIDVAAARGVELVRQHRVALYRDGERLDALAKKLDGLAGGVDNLKELDAAQGILESMTRTRARLIALERQAFNLDEGPAVNGDDKGISVVVRQF